MPKARENEDIPEAALNLISKLLCREPTQRLGAKDFNELKSHPFFDGVDFEALYAPNSEAPLLPR